MAMEGLGQSSEEKVSDMMQFIGDFMSDSVKDRSSAEHAFNLVKQNCHEDLASNLCLFQESPKEKKRAMAAVLLRKLLTGNFLQQLSPNLKSNVTTKLLLRLNEEEQKDIRMKLCLVVFAVASVYLPEWPEFWPFFCRSSDSTENRHLESALLILVKLSPETMMLNMQCIQLLFSNSLC
ncbi:hypothetical protein V5N11_002579 [Cardamine amara subsp. amara]|uniref:Exportin-1/Importin-beta-like domain-containing protein n=1 Tax=Cardamine amara subsp. amara TaxID=228776 RepID=A0ABD1BHY2_CARAN